MPRKPKAVSKDKLTEIAASLKAKAETPITITLEELVLNLAKPIQEMLDAGYSYEDVSAVFAEHGVELAASGIKNYHKKNPKIQPKSSPSLETQTETDIPEPEPELLEPELESPPKSPQTKGSAKSKFNVTDRRNI